MRFSGWKTNGGDVYSIIPAWGRNRVVLTGPGGVQHDRRRAALRAESEAPKSRIIDRQPCQNTALRCNPRLRKSASLGMGGPRKVLLDILSKFAGVNVAGFDALEQAKGYLVAP